MVFLSAGSSREPGGRNRKAGTGAPNLESRVAGGPGGRSRKAGGQEELRRPRRKEAVFFYRHGVARGRKAGAGRPEQEGRSRKAGAGRPGPEGRKAGRPEGRTAGAGWPGARSRKAGAGMPDVWRNFGGLVGKGVARSRGAGAGRPEVRNFGGRVGRR